MLVAEGVVAAIAVIVAVAFRDGCSSCVGTSINFLNGTIDQAYEIVSRILRTGGGLYVIAGPAGARSVGFVSEAEFGHVLLCQKSTNSPSQTVCLEFRAIRSFLSLEFNLFVCSLFTVWPSA